MICRIRVIGPDEVEAINRLGPEFFALANIPGEFNVNWFLINWKKLLEMGIGCLWCYRTSDDSIQGMLGAVMTPCLFTGAIVASNQFWFVSKKYRNGVAGIRLFQTYMRWAQQMEVTRINSVSPLGIGNKFFSEFFRERGFIELETIFTKFHDITQ